LLVGFAAGSSVDIIARLLAEQINKAQGLTMIVENLPGAGTLIATEAAARAAADGNTLLITSPPFVINSHLRKLNADVSRRQQCITLPDACRSDRRCTRQARHLVAGKYRPGNHNSYRVRGAQARGQR
jgi:tripartite tricarboxylate transporter family receptor